MSGLTRRDMVLAPLAIERKALRRKDWEPAYLRLGTRQVRERAKSLTAIYRTRRLCPRRCGVDRTRGQTGVCGLTATARIASWRPHFGEERPLMGRRGSGAIHIARAMLELQGRGCHNINLVTPAHIVPSIIEALALAIDRGLRLPLVYNCGGYEALEALRLLDGIVDIYLPDYKYMDSAVSARFSHGAAGYPERCAEAILEMFRQVGHLVADEQGIALRGLRSGAWCCQTIWRAPTASSSGWAGNSAPKHFSTSCRSIVRPTAPTGTRN